MILEVISLRDEAEAVRSFTLRDPDGRPLPAFAPGAHLAVEIEVAGAPQTRRYSLISDPRDLTTYRVAVQRDDHGRGGSRAMHERVRVGDRLSVTGPHDDFRLDDRAPHSVLIAGGIGITPLLSMLRALLAAGRSCELHHIARSTARLAFRDECAGLAGPRYHAHTTGDGRPDVAALLSRAPPGSHVYVCGPRSLIEAVRGWPRDRLHVESFVDAPPHAERPLRVRLAQTGLEVEVRAGASILDTLIDAGAFLSYDCRRGECGSCAALVVEGRPIHRDVCLSEAARTTMMCPCVSWADGDELVLDL